MGAAAIPAVGGAVSGLFGGGGGGSPLQGGFASLLSGGNTPQQHGYGISDPMQPQPYNTGPGLMPGQNPGVEGADLYKQGAGEKQWEASQAAYNAPGAASQWWAANQGQYGAPGAGEQFAAQQTAKYAGGTPQVTQNSATAYNASLGAQPNLSADLNPYYENAKRRSAEEINAQMAARGMMGGTPGMDRVAESFTDLNAQQARDEANYGLQRSADMRGWSGLQGQLAGQADQTSALKSQDERAWMSGLGDLAMSGQNAWLGRMGQAGQLAGQTDQADLSRLNSGMNAAMGAQNAQAGRANQLWDQQMQLSDQLSNGWRQAQENMLGADSSFMDSGMGMELGLGAEALNQGYRNQQRVKDDVEFIRKQMPILGAMGGK